MISTWPVIHCNIAFGSDAFTSTPSWTDVGTTVRSISIRTGKTYEMNRVEAGEATVELLNTSGDFWPTNTSGAYYPNIRPVTRINLQATYGGTTYDLYTGYVESWVPSYIMQPNIAPIMRLTCSDLFKCLNRSYLTTTVSTELSGTRINTILTNMGWPTATTLRIIDAGQRTLAGETLNSTNGLEYAQSVADSEIGIMYVSPSGAFIYEDSHHRSVSPHDTVRWQFSDLPTNTEGGFAAIEFSEDDSRLYNKIVETRAGGNPQTATNTTSAGLYGSRIYTDADLLLSNDTQVQLHANYLLARYKNPQYRLKNIVIKPESNPALIYPMVFDGKISDRIAVEVSPMISANDYFVEGIEARWTSADPRWNYKWQLSEANYELYTPSSVTVYLYPNAAATTDNWGSYVGVPGDYNGQKDGSDTTYVQNVGVGKYVLFPLEDLPTLADSVSTVTVLCRQKVTGPINDTIGTAIQTEGNQYDGVSSSPLAFAWVSTAYTVNPYTSTAWTAAEVNSLAAGAWAVVALEADNSEVYVSVNYIPSW